MGRCIHTVLVIPLQTKTILNTVLVIPLQTKTILNTKMSSKISEVLKHCKQNRLGRAIGVLDQQNRFGKLDQPQYQTQHQMHQTQGMTWSAGERELFHSLTTDTSLNSSLSWSSSRTEKK